MKIEGLVCIWHCIICILFFSVILEKTIRIPRSLSVRAASILKGFLNKNPVDRLGCNSDAGFTEIMTHQFFKSIEWELVSRLSPWHLSWYAIPVVSQVATWPIWPCQNPRIVAPFETHTVWKVKFLSKKPILTKPQHFHEFFTKNCFDNFSREIKVVNN